MRFTATNGSTLVLPDRMEFRPTWGYRLNKGLTANLEYRPNENTEAYLRTTLNRSATTQNWNALSPRTGGAQSVVTATSPTTGTIAAIRAFAEFREMRQLRTQALYNVSTGMKKQLGRLTLEPVVSYSYAEEVRDRLEALIWAANAGTLGPLNYEMHPGERVPRKWEFAGPDWSDPSKYLLSTVRRDDGGIIEDNTYGGRFDATWRLDKVAGGSGFLKSGVKFTRRDRVSDLVTTRWQRVGNWTLAATAGAGGPGRSIFDGRYSTPFSLDRDKVVDYIDRNPNLTQINVNATVNNSFEDDYDIVEDIYAGYAMGNIRFGKTTLLGGLRWERTEAEVGSAQRRMRAGANLGWFPVRYKAAGYDSYFPNLQAIFRPRDSLVFRGAVTQTIGRPAYEDARPFGTFSYEDVGGNDAFPHVGSLSIGNPDLKPYRATNYDLSLEWYTPKGGMVSAAVFRKDIDDPIYGFAENRYDVIYEGIALQDLRVTTRSNAQSGQIQGVELNFYQPFRFLPKPFDGLGIEANLTRVDSEVIVNTRPGEKLPFSRQPDEVRNVTLFYEKHRVSVRVAYSYMAGMMTSLGSNPTADNWSDPQERFDVQLRYRINPHYALTVAVRNLTREQEHYSFGKGGPLRETYLVGRMLNAGLSLNY